MSEKLNPKGDFTMSDVNQEDGVLRFGPPIDGQSEVTLGTITLDAIRHEVRQAIADGQFDEVIRRRMEDLGDMGSGLTQERERRVLDAIELVVGNRPGATAHNTPVQNAMWDTVHFFSAEVFLEAEKRLEGECTGIVVCKTVYEGMLDRALDNCPMILRDIKSKTFMGRHVLVCGREPRTHPGRYVSWLFNDSGDSVKLVRLITREKT